MIVPTTARERQLARQRAARRAARLAEQARRRRQRLSIAGSVLAVVLLAGGIWVLVGVSPKDTKSPSAASSAPGSAASAAPIGPCGYTSGGSAGQAARPASLPPVEPDRTGVYKATLVTNRGTVKFDLLTSKAPCAVSSFRTLASSGFFNDTPCHRLVVQPSFGVLQCGDPSGTGSGGPGYSFKDENLAGATYPKGTVAMANSGPNTNGSQFFLVFADTKLSPNYTPFGKITSGLDVLQKVAAGGVDGTGGDGAPKTAVQLQKVTVAAS
jgi:peptidyl-prolyl cis-trans isomerase B (cyclophilin B)